LRGLAAVEVATARVRACQAEGPLGIAEGCRLLVRRNGREVNERGVVERLAGREGGEPDGAGLGWRFHAVADPECDWRRGLVGLATVGAKAAGGGGYEGDEDKGAGSKHGGLLG